MPHLTVNSKTYHPYFVTVVWLLHSNCGCIKLSKHLLLDFDQNLLKRFSIQQKQTKSKYKTAPTIALLSNQVGRKPCQTLLWEVMEKVSRKPKRVDGWGDLKVWWQDGWWWKSEKYTIINSKSHTSLIFLLVKRCIHIAHLHCPCGGSLCGWDLVAKLNVYIVWSVHLH